MRNEDKDKSVHSHIHPALGLDVSLHGSIPLGRPPDWRRMKEFSQHVAPLIDLGEVGALGCHGTSLRVLGRHMEEGDILPTSSIPTLISDFVLWKEKNAEDNSLPTCDFGMGDVKEKGSHMKDVLCDRSSSSM